MSVAHWHRGVRCRSCIGRVSLQSRPRKGPCALGQGQAGGSQGPRRMKKKNTTAQVHTTCTLALWHSGILRAHLELDAVEWRAKQGSRSLPTAQEKALFTCRRTARKAVSTAKEGTAPKQVLKCKYLQRQCSACTAGPARNGGSWPCLDVPGVHTCTKYCWSLLAAVPHCNKKKTRGEKKKRTAAEPHARWPDHQLILSPTNQFYSTTATATSPPRLSPS